MGCGSSSRAHAVAEPVELQLQEASRKQHDDIDAPEQTIYDHGWAKHDDAHIPSSVSSSGQVQQFQVEIANAEAEKSSTLSDSKTKEDNNVNEQGSTRSTPDREREEPGHESHEPIQGSQSPRMEVPCSEKQEQSCRLFQWAYSQALSVALEAVPRTTKSKRCYRSGELEHIPGFPVPAGHLEECFPKLAHDHMSNKKKQPSDSAPVKANEMEHTLHTVISIFDNQPEGHPHKVTVVTLQDAYKKYFGDIPPRASRNIKPCRSKPAKTGKNILDPEPGMSI